MRSPTKNGFSISDVESQYDAYLLTARGLSRSTRNLHRHVVHRLLSSFFPGGKIDWSRTRFNDFVQFLTNEFARLRNRRTQTAWLMILRSLVRHLSHEGHIPPGWDAALPSIATRKHISLPRGLSQEQVRALWSASEGRRPRNLRDRALLLVLLRLGIRAEEVANIALADIDWRSGCLKIRSAKTYRDRVLPLPQDVGQAVAAYLDVQGRGLTHVFEPRRPPFTEQRRRTHVGNSMRYLFASAGITGRGLHSLRHTAATAMVNGGASFKDVSDVLGHKSITTRASVRCATLKKKRVSPHIVRHSTAMALLQSGVDIAVIALWLGHESIETTNVYLHADLAMKERALAKVLPVGTPFRRFQANDRLLAFLESL